MLFKTPNLYYNQRDKITCIPFTKEALKEPNIITLTDQYGESVRFELLDFVEFEDQEFAVLYPADGGDDDPVHILRITSENLELDEMEFEGLDDEDLINAVFDLFCERNDFE